MKRVDKVRETLRNFNTMLMQVRQIIHNKTTTLQSLENDVSQWWMHIEQTDSMKFAAIQKLKSMHDERGILSAASELTSIVNSSSDIDKSLRRWGRMVKLENYSRESLRAKVTDWTKRWVGKWVDLNETYKQLRAELLSSSKNYTKLYESRTQTEAILDNAQSALSAASQLTQKQNVVQDTPPPMMRGQPAAAKYACADPNCTGCGANCSGGSTQQSKYNSIPEVVKPVRQHRRTQGEPTFQAPAAPKQQQQQFDMNNMPPELMAQLMQYQQSGGGGGIVMGQQPEQPPPPKKKKRRKKVSQKSVAPGYTMKPITPAISYGADQWG